MSDNRIMQLQAARIVELESAIKDFVAEWPINNDWVQNSCPPAIRQALLALAGVINQGQLGG